VHVGTPEDFVIDIPQARLDELKRRLDHVAWPHDFDNDDWRYGVPADYLRGLVDEWRDGFDWRAQEAAMNAWPHRRVEIDGLPIHFLHAKGRGPAPIPLILSHGWPWTFWDFHALIGPLSDPAAHGGDPADAFDVVVPSLPGFVFSTPLTRSGVSWLDTADLWATLMTKVLGYERFAAHGGDWGAMVTTQLGHKYAEQMIGIHLTNAFPVPAFGGERPWAITDAVGGQDAGPEERARLIRHQAKFASHMATHMLHPQTLAYAMHDSPVGLLAWMLEKRMQWGDCRGDVESRFSREFLLTTMSLYWLTESFVTSVRYYAEAARADWKASREGMPQVPLPTGLSLFEYDLPPGPTDWMHAYYDVRLENRRDDGGHFAAAENPTAVLDDLRTLFRPLR
jgi:pimeloyl-ACP methyl ester carboxylesterase